MTKSKRSKKGTLPKPSDIPEGRSPFPFFDPANRLLPHELGMEELEMMLGTSDTHSALQQRRQLAGR